MSRNNSYMAVVVFAAVMAGTAAIRPAGAAPRLFSFHVANACTCASCAFEAPRALNKIDGVKKTTLHIKEHRLDILFDDAKTPISTLSNAVAKLDMGKDSTLVWKVDGDAARAAEALGRLPGVHTATADGKSHTVALTFAKGPAVTAAQVDTAVKEGAVEAHN
jgi:copper chaperone CopZ